MDTLKVKNFGPIAEANVEFGDLTILVGPQASGKSIFLQLLKLINDKESIINTLKEYGYVWENENELLELYLGEGMKNILNNDTLIHHNNKEISHNDLLISTNDKEKNQHFFYIPAQRVLTIQGGWPRPFRDYGNDPYVLKMFSDITRLFLEGIGRIFFNYDIVKRERDALYKSIFYEGVIELETSNYKKRFILNINNNKLPYMVWSTGQKEFFPLWLSLIMFTGPNAIKHADKTTIIIEEPEMGLHPKAISQFILAILDFISKGYKVIISTHSPVFIEFAWAFQYLKRVKAKEIALIELFDLPESPTTTNFFRNILDKKLNTYYFDRENDKVHVKDISSLDAGSEDMDIAEWGGLSTFVSRATDIVSKYYVDEN